MNPNQRFLAVSLFVGAGFQHSPANMAYFSLAAGAGIGPGWGAALGWNILPAALGNLLGGFLHELRPRSLSSWRNSRMSIVILAATLLASSVFSAAIGEIGCRTH